MRVLVVDQDSASNEAIARSLRELFTVDAVTNKGDCLDLLRSNTFEVIVATERLDDGSGLELLGHVGKKWPSMLRIFAADRERLKLLRGRLGPFQLFQTLAYPVDADRLIATLNLAEAAQSADADTSAIQHVELTGDFSDLDTGEEAEESEHSEEPADPEASEESGQFPSPEPLPRAASADSHGGLRGRSGDRGAPQYQARSRGAATSRHGGAVGATAPRGAPGPSASRGA
jgi:CheY-like chemotaxis protein